MHAHGTAHPTMTQKVKAERGLIFFKKKLKGPALNLKARSIGVSRGIRDQRERACTFHRNTSDNRQEGDAELLPSSLLPC